jgi:glycosyltransferase involved in cell wall biosynthesis
VELVVVANACSDGTRGVVESAAPRLPIPSRLVEEPRPNLALARNVGVASSRGEILAMLDDDVRADPAWLSGLLEAYEALPVDLVAGRVLLEWKGGGRPSWLSPRLERRLSQRDHGLEVKELFKAADPLGANFSFRRRVFDALGGFTPGLGRTGKRLLGEEEVDFVRRALERGFRVGYAPRALVGHFMFPERTTPSYLASLAFGSARSRMHAKPSRSPVLAAREAGEGLLRAARALAVIVWHRLRGDEVGRVEAMIDVQRGLGRALGAWERVLRRTGADDLRRTARDRGPR